MGAVSLELYLRFSLKRSVCGNTAIARVSACVV